MIIDCISDLHGHYPELEGGDLLIVAGDLTRSDEPYQYEFLYDILSEKQYGKIIIIAGNHDGCLESRKVEFVDDDKITYLCDSGTQFEGLKIWGTPWTKTFPSMNPLCMAFTCETEEELAEKWLTCPIDTDIIVCHGPPYGILDVNRDGDCCGSKSLRELMFKIKPCLMIWGHIHECGGNSIDLSTTLCINASYVNERYEPKNKAIRIEFDKKNKRAIRLN